MFHSRPTPGLYFPAEGHAVILLKRQGYSLRHLFLNLYVSLLVCWWWQPHLPELVGLAHASPSACTFGVPSLFLASPCWRVWRVTAPGSCWLSCSCKCSWIRQTGTRKSLLQLTSSIFAEQVREHLYRNLTSSREVLGSDSWINLLQLTQLQLEEGLWISPQCKPSENHYVS